MGLFYSKMYGSFTRKTIGKFIVTFNFLISLCVYTKRILDQSILFLLDSIYKLDFALITLLLVIMSGDVETNPGPINQTSSDHCVSILHCNIRSLRNKLEYVLDNFCDFDVICFTETHLDTTICMKIFSWAISMTLLTEKIELVTVVELLYICQLVLFIKEDLILRYSGTNVFGWKSE